MSDFFDALDRYTKSNSKSEVTQGVIANITGNTAMVKLTGSQQLVEAWYSKGASINVGEQCVLVRTNRTARWIVMGGFGTNNAGSAGSSENAASVLSNAGAGGSLSGTYPFGNVTTYATFYTLNINSNKVKSNIAAFFTGYVSFQSVTNVLALVRMLCNGTVVASDTRVTGTAAAGHVAMAVSLAGAVTQAPSGLYTFEVQAQSTISNGAANDLHIVGSSFFAMES